MSRNKENYPPRSHKSLSIPTLIKPPPSDDFFTDSLLDASSAFPTPNPRKILPEKSRRVLGPALNLKRRRTSPLRNGRSTTPPPPRRSATLLTSPHSDASSPPRGLEDTYQRIADEEDLAATEGDLGSSGSEEEVKERQTNHVQPQEFTGQNQTTENITQGLGVNGFYDPAELPGHEVSQNSTPVQLPVDAKKENQIHNGLEDISDASGMSFLDQLTDQDLAAKLTPHTVNRAKDRARVSRALQNQVPITFNKPQKFEGNGVSRNKMEYNPQVEDEQLDANATSNRKSLAFGRSNGFIVDRTRRANSDAGVELLPVRRLPSAFSRAGKITTSSPSVDEDDGSDTPPELREREKIMAFSRASRILTGFKKPVGAVNGTDLTEANLGLQANDRRSPNASSASSIRSHQSEPTMSTSRSGPIDAAAARDYFLRMRERKKSLQRKVESRLKPGESSQIDWAAAAADVALPSIEKSNTPIARALEVADDDSTLDQPVQDRRRKWDNDFTGLSFQVSESPVVRNKAPLGDYGREKEIENLSKQGVTTNRLERIREQSPEEVRKSSPSAALPASIALKESVSSLKEDADVSMTGAGEQIPDTPIVVYRSSSSMDSRRTESISTSRPSLEKQESHNQLQRLAKAMRSSSSPSPGPEIRPFRDKIKEELGHKPTSPSETNNKRINSGERNGYSSGIEAYIPTTVAETPRVVGAWNDTVLPDTIKTVKQRNEPPKYIQTPHVSAGGWIDTPMPSGKRQSSALAPMTIDELTEEVDKIEEGSDGRLGEKKADIISTSTEHTMAKSELNGEVAKLVQPTSALGALIDHQKQKRLVSRDITTAFESNDTLNLGDATIESLEDLLSLNADDMTTLLRMGEDFQEQGMNQTVVESELLERLGSKLERLRNNIHDARKGISKLEREVSHPPSELIQTQTAITQQAPPEICLVCGRSNYTHSHSSTFVTFPVIYSTFTLPIPLLFYPSNPLTHRKWPTLPRPTFFGWLTIFLWAWYVIEITMSEIYSHPLFAESYHWPEIPEPVFPYVLPTMLYRWSRLEVFGPLLLGPLWRIIVAFCRISGMAFGWTDGFVDSPSNRPGMAGGNGRGDWSQASKVVADAVTKATVAVTSAIIGDDTSMMEDEFI